MSGIEVIELIGIICVTVVILAFVYVTKIKCSHNWEKIDEVDVYEYDNSKRPCYRKYVYHCKKCGKFKIYRT